MPLCASGELYLISDYRSLLSYEAFPTVAGKFNLVLPSSHPKRVAKSLV